MGTVEPTGEQLKELAAAEGRSDQPIVMINLLRFRGRAEYADGFEAEPCSGEEAYRRYSEGALAAMREVGGEPIWGANANQVVIGPTDERWDQAFLVRYPSRARFLEMVADPGYQEIVPHRTAALSDSRLILCEAPERAPEAFGAGG